MSFPHVVVSLPIADRKTSYTFYRDGLGLDATGPIADDGFPEPLQFILNEGVNVMLIPTGGFGWIIGDREVAGRRQSECVLTLPMDTETEVDELVERARRAGAGIVAEPTRQPWGYIGAFTDPDGHVWMVMTVA
ncbi:VOC family protein [Streptomyces sp. NPDC058001]|uniref:VOC family protein n=1 Tax=Streptomyces sp. NPDC058001 TaxID=3346300 RepID=UPI0036E1E15F